MDDISTAVDKAMSASPGSSPTEPTPSPSPAGTAAASSSASPAAGSGFESTASSASKGSASASTQPDDGDDELQDASWGAIPLERRQSILDNARKKEAARVTKDLTAAFQTRYGLTAEDDDREIQFHLNGLRTGSQEYLRWMAGLLEQRGFIRRHSEPAPAALERPTPSYPAQAVDGSTVMLYGPDDIEKLLAYERQQITDSLAARFKPLEQSHQAFEEQRIVSTAQRDAEREFNEAKAWDAFDDLRPEIFKRMSADRRKTLLSTYNEVYQEHVKTRTATLEATTRQKLLAELKNAPAPQTIVPGTSKPSASAPKSHSLDGRIDDAVTRALAAASA